MKLRSLCNRVAWTAVGAIVGAFFLPWVGVKADAFGAFEMARQKGWGDVLSPFEQQIKASIKNVEETQGMRLQTQASVKTSGFDIPRMVNTKDSQKALAFVALFTDKTEGLEWKSYGVYFFPVAAIVIALLYQCARNPGAGFIAAGLAAAVFGLSVYKLTHLPLQSWVTKVEIGWGLVATLAGYAVLAAAVLVGSLVLLLSSRK